MFDDVSDEDRDALIDKIAKKVSDRGLETPAVLFLEMHKPLTFLASQSLIVSSPLTGPILGMERVGNAAKLLEKRENIELLIQKIEELAANRQARKTPKPEVAP
jgi:hypothetical protein